MNPEKGLLLFVCVLLLMVATILNLPLFTAAERLALYSEGVPLQGRPMAFSLRLPGSTKVYAHDRQALLQEISGDRRPDDEIAGLTAANHLSAADLKAFLAASSRGVADQEGLFYVSLPGEPQDSPKSALERCREATGQLADLQRRTGSFEAAVLGWVVGASRAERLARLAGRQRDLTGAARLFLLSPLRDRALGFLCLVTTLRDGLSATWPVEKVSAREEGGGLVLVAQPGEAVAAPLSGTVQESGGGCVLVDHGCGLRSELCGLQSSTPAGSSLRAGQRAGVAAGEVKFSLLLGSLPLDPWVLSPR